MNLYKVTNTQGSFHLMAKSFKKAGKKATKQSYYKVKKITLIEENIE